MRRASVVSLLLALVALSGCGQSNELVTLDRVGSPDAPHTLSFQMNAGYTPQAAVPEVAANFKKAFADWARRHPEWRLSLTVIPDSQGPAEQARLLERARVGTAPDCASVDSFSLPLFIQQKALVPLDRYFSKAEVDDLLPFVRRTVHGPDGHLYAWWWSTDLRLIYRNVDLVPKAPRTWDELIAFAKAAHEKDPKVDGYLYNGGRYEGTFFDNLGYFWMQGGKLLDADGRPVFAEGADRAAMLKMLGFLRKTVTSGASPARVATINDYDVLQQAVEGGSVAMFLGGSFQWPNLRERPAQGRAGEVEDLAAARHAPRPDLDRHRAAGPWRRSRTIPRRSRPARRSSRRSTSARPTRSPGSCRPRSASTAASRRSRSRSSRSSAACWGPGSPARASRSIPSCPTRCRSRSGRC